MAPQAAVRVLVLDGSAPRRQRLQRLLENVRALQVVAAVANVDQAVESAARRQADVILLVQGNAQAEAVSATRGIMQARATPIVVLTAASDPRQQEQAFALMEAGALAVLHDPGPSSDPRHAALLQRLLTALRLMSEVRVVRRWAATAGGAAPPPVPAAPVLAQEGRAPQRKPRGGAALVAIGASTGGPVALKQLLCALPADFPAPLVIVQHMADGFLQGMAHWLSAACTLPVVIAGEGTALRPGHAYLAPDGLHMRVDANGGLAFDGAPPVNGHRPAVSCLLASVAEHYGRRAVGVLLTGMGKDGAAELKLMRDAGAVTIAQDEASSVVHGMPGEAIRRGAAMYVMSPQEIGAALPALVRR